MLAPSRGHRAVGEHADGFAITASKTVAVPVDRLYDAFVDEPLRERWLPDGRLRERTATKPRSARFDRGDGETRVVVGFTAKGAAKSVVDIEHARLRDSAASSARVSAGARWRRLAPRRPSHSSTRRRPRSASRPTTRAPQAELRLVASPA